MPTDFLPAIQWIYLIFSASFVIKDNKQSTEVLAPVLYWTFNYYSVLWLSSPLYLLCHVIQVRGFKCCLFLSESTWLWVTETPLYCFNQKWGFIDSHNWEVNFRNGSVKGLHAASAHFSLPWSLESVSSILDLMLIRLWPPENSLFLTVPSKVLWPILMELTEIHLISLKKHCGQVDDICWLSSPEVPTWAEEGLVL